MLCLIVQNLEAEVARASQEYLRDKRHFEEEAKSQDKKISDLKQQLATERTGRQGVDGEDDFVF